MHTLLCGVGIEWIVISYCNIEALNSESKGVKYYPMTLYIYIEIKHVWNKIIFEFLFFQKMPLSN